MQLEHSEFQDQLVRGLAHRMNNILTLFHGYVGLMLDNKKLDAATLDGLQKIKDGAKAASELMDRTHSLVRPTAVVLREIDLGSFLQLLRPGFESFRGKTTTIEIAADDSIPPVRADMTRVKTAVSELVRNGCEAVALTGGSVRIEVHAEPPPQGKAAALHAVRWVTISVSDDGPAIPPELEEKIFAPFFTTKRKQNAAGLGLTVARECVTQLGGALRHRREKGRTIFELQLPCGSEL